MVNIVIYEDEGYKNFLPLTWTRPVYALRCGINTLAEKIVRHYPKAKAQYSCRYYLPGAKLMHLERGLFINGRILAAGDLAKLMPLKGEDEVFVSHGEVVAVRAVTAGFSEVRKHAPHRPVSLKMVKYPWHLITEMAVQLQQDRNFADTVHKKGLKHPSVVLYNHKDVIIAQGAQVEANTVIDAREGPVYIGPGTIVRPQTYLKGPLVLGPVCRVGGEVGESIFHGYTNKQHYGFIGHAYIGEWVNLGAGTTNSDLKNNYSTVKVEINRKSIDSGEKFVGCFVGDFAKTGIGTLITTGAVIGIGANIFGGGVTGKLTPCFAWGAKDRYKLPEFMQSVALMLQRRGKTLAPAQAKMLETVYKFCVR